MPDNNKIIIPAEIKPEFNQAAAEKKGDQLGNAVGEAASKAYTKSFDPAKAGANALKEALASAGSMKGKRALVSAAMPTKRQMGLTQYKKGANVNEGLKEEIGEAKVAEQTYKFAQDLYKQAEKSRQKNQQIRTEEREKRKTLEAKYELAEKKAALEQQTKAEERAAKEQDRIQRDKVQALKRSLNEARKAIAKSVAERKKAAEEEAEARAAAEAKENERIRSAVAKTINPRDEAGKQDYTALVNMYKKLETMRPSEVDAAYASFTDATGGAAVSPLTAIINMMPKLVEVRAAIMGVKESLTEKFDTPLLHALRQIKDEVGGSLSAGLAKAKNALKGFGRAVKTATKPLARFGQVLVWRLYRMAAMKTLQQIAQGFKNLTSYSRTFGTQFAQNIDRLKTSVTYLGNAFAAMVAPIINFVTPALEKLMDTIAALANRIGQVIATALGQKQFSAALKHMVSDAKGAGGKMKDILGFDELNRLSGDTGAGDESSRMFEEWGPAEEGASGVLSVFERLKAIFEQLKEAFAPVWTAIKDLGATLLPIILNAVLRIAEAVAPVIAALAPAIKAIIEGLAPIVSAILDPILFAIEAIMPFIQRIINALTPLIQSIMPALAAAIGVLGDVIKLIITIATPIIDIIVHVIELIGGILKPIIDVLTVALEAVRSALDPIISVVSSIVTLITAVLDPVLEVVKGIIIALANVIGAVLTVAIRIVQAAIEGLAPVLKSIGSLFEKIGNGITMVWTAVKVAILKVVDTVTQAWETVKKFTSKGGEIFEGIKDGITVAFKFVVNGIIKGINAVIATPFRAINGILTTIRDISILGFQPFKDKIRLLAVPQIPLLAKGGAIDNRGTLFMANEAGPEVVANQGRSTGVMNTDQMQAAIAAGNTNVVEAIYTMMESVVASINNKDTNFYMDGQKVAQTVTKHQRNFARQYGV